MYDIEINNQYIVREELYTYPHKVNIFKRTTNKDKQLTNIKFGNHATITDDSLKGLEANTLWNNSVLGGSLKTNLDQTQIKEVIEWFADYLQPIILPRTDLKRFASKKIKNEVIDKNIILEILQKADLDITDICLKEEEIIIPDSMFELIEKNYTDLPIEKIKQLKDKGKLTTLDLKFEHTVNDSKYELEYEKESMGTKRYYGLACILYLMINEPNIVPIDELESSLHPDLFNHFLLLFLVNSNNSQIIATTHNRELLSDKDIFRNDAIWITDKSRTNSTELYSLADFNTDVIRNTSNILNAYKSGKLGGIPNLGDYYLNLDDEVK